MDDDSGGKGTYYCILGRSRSFPAALEEHTSSCRENAFSSTGHTYIPVSRYISTLLSLPSPWLTSLSIGFSTVDIKSTCTSKRFTHMNRQNKPHQSKTQHAEVVRRIIHSLMSKYEKKRESVIKTQHAERSTNKDTSTIKDIQKKLPLLSHSR